MKLWGLVAEVNEKDLVVSLPGGLRGLVQASEALDPISNDEIEVCNKLFSLITHSICLPLTTWFLLFFNYCYVPTVTYLSLLSGWRWFPF